MPSLAEIRKISLHTLHRSATQNWEKQNRSLSRDKKFLRSSSMPALKIRKKNEGNQSTNRPERASSSKYIDDTSGRKMSSSSDSEDDNDDLISESTDRSYQNIMFGFQKLARYEQPPKTTDIMDILYNGRVHRFFLLDSRGIVSWDPSAENTDKITRELHFPKYKTKLLRSVIFCKKHNVFFAICSDFTLKVYNKDFHETFKTENKSMRSILHLVFNPVTDELISSGVAGTVVWKYKQTQRNLFDTIKPMANYELQLHARYPNIGGTWCTKVELISSSQYLFYCSDMDLYAYDARDMRKLFVIHGAHSAALTCIGFSSTHRTLLTGSVDCEVKVWGASGGHVCTLRGHSRPVTSILIHPDIPGLVFSSSMDGTIKVWSLHTMDLFSSLSVFSEGIRWMNLTDDGMIWCANLKKISVYKFDAVVSFWGHTRCCITDLKILNHSGKTKRLMAVGEDGSVRLFSQSTANTSALCTVLPPPVVSLLDNVRDVTASRYHHLFFILINPTTIWVYTAKTDPACRISAWNIPVILKERIIESSTDTELEPATKSTSTTSISSQILRSFEEKKIMHGCTQILSGKTKSSACCCILAVYSENGFQYHSPLGLCCAKSRHLLLFGLEDGRVIFLDQKQRGLLYCELQVSKDAIKSMKYENEKSWLITQTNNNLNVMFYIWKLPELELLYKISAPITTTCYTILDNTVITGHSNGQVILFSIAPTDENADSSIEHDKNHSEHKDKITDVKACKKQNVFCTCSADGFIKIWDSNKTLLTDIKLGEDLTCCDFLNDHGDLIIGWKRHLFLIDHKTLSLDEESGELSDNVEKESDIYEDPSIRYENNLKTKSKPSTITMYKYLVPYGFIATEGNDNIDLKKMQEEDKAGSDDSEGSEHTLCAMTDTYLSPATSMESFGIIDTLFPRNSPDHDKVTKTSDVIFPEFGISPGPTPPESVFSNSNEECLFIEDDIVVLEEAPDHPWMMAEKKVDLKEKLSTGVVVAKAIRKMSKKKKDEIVATQPIKSRFASAEIDAKDMMKKGMNVVFAVESMQKDRKKKKTSSAHDRPLSAKHILKKTRRPSTASLRRKSLHPTEIPLQPWQVKDDGSAGDSDSSPIEVQLDTRAVEKKLMELGLKMTPQHKVNTSLPEKPSSAAQFHRKKQAISSAKPNVPVSSKLKRRISESAAVNRRKSTTHKDGNKSLIVNNTPVPEPSKLLNQLNNSHHIKSPIAQGNFTHEATSLNKPVTHVDMKYRQQFAEKSEDNTLKNGMENNETEPDLVNAKISNEQNEGQTISSSTNNSSSLFQSSSQDEITDNKSHLKSEQHLQSIAETNGEEVQDIDCLNMREILDKRRIEEDGDSDDDEMIIPNLLEYDFHAIYKKDGLQFDEKWQDRMLERYLLLKLQKEQRQEAAMNKRIFLEQERQFRLLASQPDLLQKYNEPWYEDPDLLANYILNSNLMQGKETPSNHMENHDYHLYKRPMSEASIHKDSSDRWSERDRHFRFSIRDQSNANTHDRSSFLPKCTKISTPPNNYLPPTSFNSNTTLRTKSSCSSFQRLATERPRSSTSIPGKTRYILIKSGKTKKPDKAPSPTKLEENLLKKRFPSQHCHVMKSLGRLDELELSDYDEITKAQQCLNSRVTTPVFGNRHAQTAIPDTGGRHLQKRYKSETDAHAVTRNTPVKGFGSVLDQTEPSSSVCYTNSWMSPSSNVCINPLDIVKRKSSGNIPHQKHISA
ncbi:uncharacterized protein LOC120338981 isoform X1 [Styela clava]